MTCRHFPSSKRVAVGVNALTSQRLRDCTFRSVLTRSSALAPLGERVARRGVFISRDGTGEGVQAQRAYPTASLNVGFHGMLAAKPSPPRPAERWAPFPPRWRERGLGPPSPPKGRGLSLSHSTVSLFSSFISSQMYKLQGADKSALEKATTSRRTAMPRTPGRVPWYQSGVPI